MENITITFSKGKTKEYEKNTDFAGIFTMRPRDSVGNHIAASPYRGDESDMKPVIDFGP